MMRRTVFLLLCYAALTECTYLGKIGYECLSDHTCSVENGECRFERCHCKVGFSHTYVGTEIQCIQLPLLGMPCQSTGETRDMKCADHNAACIDGKCVCESLYEEVNGKCVFQERQLGQSCSADKQCITPYTNCNEIGICECELNPNKHDGKCIPTELQCLTGSQVSLDDNPVNCTIPSTEGYRCPDGFFCTPYFDYIGHWSCDSPRKLFGVCCPIPKAKSEMKPRCPIGNSLSVWHPCPADTHYKFLNPYIEKVNSPCCLRACPSGYEYVGQKCIKIHLYPGDHCDVDEQCSCGICQLQSDGDKRCECAKGFQEFYGKCHDVRCFHGEPAKNAETGELQLCNSTSSSCPTDYLCIQEFGLCCPRMPIYT